MNHNPETNKVASSDQHSEFDTSSSIAQQNIGADTVSRSVELETPHDSDELIRELVTDSLDGASPDAIFPLSGGIAQRKNGNWRTLSGTDGNEHGLITISRARVIAGAKIAQLFPEATVVANSFNRFNPDEPTMASVAKQELLQRSIPEEQIMLEEQSFSTITQYTEMVKLAIENNWKNIAVIINEYYEPRAAALYDHLDSIVEDDDFQDTLTEFKENNGKVSFIVCDEVMGHMNPHYTEYLNRVKQTEAYENTVESEARGLKDLLDGKYRVVLSPEKPRN